MYTHIPTSFPLKLGGALWGSLQGFWKEWFSRDLKFASPGCEHPGSVITKHKFSHEPKAHFRDYENPCLQNPC